MHERIPVLIFIEDGSFTFDNRVQREARALVDAGYDVAVLSPRYPQDPWVQRLGPHLVSYHFPKPNAESALGHVAEHGISLAAGSAGAALIRLLHGFRVFHACNPMDIGWLIAWPHTLTGVRYLFDQHDLCPELYLSRGEGDERSPFYRALCRLERGAYRHAHAVIATNESYKRLAVTRGGCKEEAVFVVRNGPDLAKFRRVSPNPAFVEPGTIRVGYLGNMNKQDGVESLLDAAEELVRRGRHDLRFLLVGGGAHQAWLKAEAVRRGLGAVVTFTGRVSDDDMLAALCACDLAVQPDPLNPLNDKSTMNKVMEYMALGLPVVAYDLTETRVSAGEAALLVDPATPHGLAEAILALADDPARRTQLAAAGLLRVHDKLAWPYSVPALLAAYRYALHA